MCLQGGLTYSFLAIPSLSLIFLIYQLHHHYLPLDTYHLPSITITHHQYPCLLGTSPPLPLAERIPPVPRHARSLASARGLPAARSRRALQDGAPAGGQACPGDRGWAAAGPRSRRSALTLPAAGTAARNTSRSAGGLSAAPGRMVGARSEPRRVQGPAGSPATRPLRGTGWGARLWSSPGQPARGGFCRAQQRGSSLPTEAGGWLQGRGEAAPVPPSAPSPPAHQALSLRPGPRAQAAREGCAPAGQVSAPAG